MINVSQLRDLLAANPFRPFWIETSEGTQIEVQKPEWYYEPPGLPRDGEFVVFTPTGTHVLNHRDIANFTLSL
jgi:hypothetical protein